jgi:hypothetical protein
MLTKTDVRKRMTAWSLRDEEVALTEEEPAKKNRIQHSRINYPIQISMFQISKMKMCKPGRDTNAHRWQIQDVKSKFRSQVP